jgi:hypothetical protein
MPREGRSQRLESWGDELVSIYTGVVDGREVEIPFVAPEEPLVEGFGGEEPSELLDPAQWLLHADRMAASVPSSPEGLEPDAVAEAARRLERAAACLEEVIKFVPDGERQIPLEAMWTPIGKVTWMKEPGRFGSARLQAVADTYRKIAGQFSGD